MRKIVRLLAVGFVAAFAHANGARAESAYDRIGTFPDCEWRVPTWRTDGKQALFCPNGKGKLWQLSFNEEFSERTLERAREGDAHAIGIVGQVYLDAFPPFQDVRRGSALLNRASDLGDTHAMTRLAILYDFQPASQREAVRLLKIAADKGDTDAMLELGKVFQSGVGVVHDIHKAVEWVRKSADAGNVDAMLELAYWYDGDHTELHDDAESARWFRAAANAGDYSAMSALQSDYAMGRGVPKDTTEARRWGEKWRAGRIAWLEARLARLGVDRDPYAATALGRLYFNGSVSGRDAVDRDTEMGLQWYQKAADAGDEEAASTLEMIYREGLTVPANPAKADFWAARKNEIRYEVLRASAESGNAQDMNRLGYLELTGKDPEEHLATARNVTEGVQWLRKAAEAGNAEAMFRLSQIYTAGQDVPKDEAEGKRWSRKAAVTDPSNYASADELLMSAENKDPSTMLIAASKLFEESRQDEAVFWLYEADLRTRAYFVAHPCHEPGCQEGLILPLGMIAPFINTYAAGDIPKFSATIQRVLAWDESHADPYAGAAIHQKEREQLRTQLDAILPKLGATTSRDEKAKLLEALL